MKKIICALMLFVALAFTACSSCENSGDTTPTLKWYVEATATGEGYLGMTFPTGKMVLTGNGEFSLESKSDSLFRAIPEGTPNFEAILADPDAYSDEQVYAAEAVSSAIAVDSMSGKWAVDATGYVEYAGIYIVIDQHWPKQDTTAVEVPALDTVAVK